MLTPATDSRLIVAPADRPNPYFPALFWRNMTTVKIIDQSHKISDKRRNGNCAGKSGLMRRPGSALGTRQKEVGGLTFLTALTLIMVIIRVTFIVYSGAYAHYLMGFRWPPNRSCIGETSKVRTPTSPGIGDCVEFQVFQPIDQCLKRYMVLTIALTTALFDLMVFP